MTAKVLLVELGAAGLPATTAPLQIYSTWVPAVYTPPPLATPTGVAVLPIVDAAVISFVPTPGCESVIEIAPDVGGSPGAWTLRTQTADASHTIPITYGTLKWIRLKAVRNGRSSAYTADVLASALMLGSGPGRNLIGNPSFETNTVSATNVAIRIGLLCNLWKVQQSNGSSSYAKRVQNDGNSSGEYAAEVQVSGETLANAALLYTDAVQYIPNVDVISMQTVRVRARLKVSGSGNLLGCPVSTYVALLFFNAAGVVLDVVVAAQSAQVFIGLISSSGAVPVGTVRATLLIQGWVFNNTGSSKALTGEMLRIRADDVEVVALTNLDTDAEDGTTHGRIAMQDTYAVSGVNRLGVSVSTSGQRVTARNMPATVSASVGSLWDGLTLSSTFDSSTPSNVTINATAAILRASGAAPSYAASSGIVSQARGTTVRYYCYYLDPTLDGGTKSMQITTVRTDVANRDDIAYLDSIVVTVSASDGGTGGDGGNNGGGGGYLPVP